MVLSIVDKVVDFMTPIMENFKEWIIDNSMNPILYIGLFVLGLLIFLVTYRALSK